MQLRDIEWPRCGKLIRKDVDEMVEEAEENVAFVGCDCGEEFDVDLWKFID